MHKGLKRIVLTLVHLFYQQHNSTARAQQLTSHFIML